MENRWPSPEGQWSPTLAAGAAARTPTTVADPSFSLSKFPIPEEFTGIMEQLESVVWNWVQKVCENQIRVSVGLTGEEQEGEMEFWLWASVELRLKKDVLIVERGGGERKIWASSLD